MKNQALIAEGEALGEVEGERGIDLNTKHLLVSARSDHIATSMCGIQSPGAGGISLASTRAMGFVCFIESGLISKNFVHARRGHTMLTGFSYNF